MKRIQKQITVDINKLHAFSTFITLNEWWPKEYTWSGDSLLQISIDPQLDGLCTETGPYGFRCDWGRVIGIKEYDLIELKWQISANREPVPNPQKASNVRISFDAQGDTITQVTLEHYNFENHDDAESYLAMMDSENGWEYILQKFQQHVHQL